MKEKGKGCLGGVAEKEERMFGPLGGLIVILIEVGAGCCVEGWRRPCSC